MKKWISLFLCLSLALSLSIAGAQAAPPAEVGSFCSQEEWETLKLTNRERLSQDLPPLSTFPALQQAADVREQDLAQQYSHVRPDGSQWSSVLSQLDLGFRAAGENIAAGQRSASQVVSAWMGSEGHRANILNADYAHMGAGYSSAGFLGTSWVQLFLTDGCSVSGITLSQNSVSCSVGAALDELELYVQAQCPVHGACYLPLLSGMCSGFDSSAAGVHSVSVSYGGHTATLTVSVGDNAIDLSSASGWAANWITEANASNLLSPRNQTGFTANVTRLQFADLAVRLAEQLTGTAVTPAPADSFIDTTEEVILKAKAAGIAAGYQDAVTGRYEFRPDNPISRQEICVMLTHVLEYVESAKGGVESWNRSTDIPESFPDRDKVAGWAAAQVAQMTNNSIMSGKSVAGGVPAIDPEASTSLEEAITLAVKLQRILA